ncbi:autoantigen p27 domain-containing protein [Methanogenium organophilum]|uniref:Autoantigen p27 domain-containing protein n=1 Tax=Methanogenium organophilum TaxID=2199 RepID=A0A9X9T8J9_METOG|nr:autoantigen p27 domain-containing protein [Methanogenium organophilum]WAI01242.1 autoantigen p27 domain-containing protein [Methanogenium organophilum]
MKTEDEVMASVLLTGGKMLSVTCEDCGAPLFEVEGKQCCVVCKELGKPDDSEEIKQNLPVKSIVETRPVQGQETTVHESVMQNLELAICALCKKAIEASRSEDAKLYMDAVRAGTEALRVLK